MLHICYEISNYNEHALKIYVFNIFFSTGRTTNFVQNLQQNDTYIEIYDMRINLQVGLPAVLPMSRK